MKTVSFIIMACEGMAYIVSAYKDKALYRYGLHGYGPTWLRPYIVTALYRAYIDMAYVEGLCV